MSTSSRPLRVVLVWQGEPLEERIFDRPQRITVGPGPSDTFTTPASPLGEGFPLFRSSPDSAGFVLSLAPGMTGKLSLERRPIAVSQFLAEGHGIPAGDRREQPLGTSDWGIVGLDPRGDVAIFFQFVSPSIGIGPGASWLDRFLGQAFAFSAIVHVALLVLAFVLWEPQDALDIDPPPNQAIAKILLDQPPEPPEEPKPDKSVRKVREDDASKRAAGKEGKVGNPDAKDIPTKIPRGPRDQIAAKVSQLGLLGTLKSGKQSAALKSLLSDTNADVTMAMAGLKGAQLQVGRGSGGMSTRGDGQGGGGTGQGQLLGVGKLAIGGGGTGARATGSGGGRVAKELKVAVTTGTPSTAGGLSKEQVLRVVQSHAAAIQFCYEKELQRFPHLAGKVMLGWKVGTDGRVQGAKVDSSSLGNASTESCMVRQVKNWSFPKSAGVTDVHFPFFFKGQ